MRILSTLLFCFALLASDTGERTREIVAHFSKSKHVNKTKRGVTRARFVERHGEPVVRPDRSWYAGAYTVQGLGFSLQLAVEGGRVSGSGEERGRAFTLRDARIDGALLTATKVYANGATERLEGVFMDLVSREGTSPETAVRTRAFGLGVLTDRPIAIDGGLHVEKLFYERGSVPRS